jgi:hypothetical protein
MESGGLLNQRWVSTKSGATPRMGRRSPALASSPPASDAVEWTRSEARSSATMLLSSIPSVGLTRAAGTLSASQRSNLMSTSVASSTATETITAPIA